jgi:hypothetical protein
MAQIIKHRRGSLESISSATKRAGELLVVTGSAGISATNGNSILFVGIDGSTATPANKILQGSETPNLTGASYDTSINGIPFYNTSAEKLYILNKGGNVEVKATANTGGTGIVSGSSQVTDLLPAGTVSGSSQVTISSTTGYTDFSSSLNSRLVTVSTNVTELYTTASDHETRIDSIESSIGGASGIGLRVSSLEAFTGSQETKNSTLATYTGSVNSDLSALHTFTASQESKDSTLATYTGSIDTKNSTLGTYTASLETKNSTLGTYTGSIDTKFSTLGNYTASINSFTSSEESKNSTLATYTASVDSHISAINSYTSSLRTAFTASGADVTFSGNVTIPGNLTVAGTQTIVDSTTVQIGDNIIELNGSGVANGGLYVKDATAPNTATGSLLWDSTNDYWKAGVKDSESKILLAGGDSVVSGSSQITISSTTGYADFSGSIASSISASVAASTWENLNGKPAGIVSGSSQVVDYLVSQNISVAGISGSSLNITGNAKIDGNLTLGGNITIGDATTDTVSFAADLTSDIIPSGSNVRSLGSASRLFANVYATNIYGAINATNGVVSGSSQILGGSGLFSGSSQVDADSITNFDSNVKAKLDAETVVSGSSQITYANISSIPAGIVSGSSQLDSTTINLAKLTSVEASGSFSGSFKGDGSNLTGIASTLAFSGSTGNDTLNLKTEALLVTGSNSISAAVSDNTITITAANASTSAKGVASFDADDFSVTSGNVSIKENGVRAVNLNADVAGTGLSLDGVDNSIEVDYGSTAGTAVEGNTSLTVQGTTNEIEITGGSITLGSGGTVTIGLPDSVTIATASIQNNLSVGGSVTITGNLFVDGTTTTIDSTTIQLGDNIIELNGSGGLNAGLLVKDITSPNTASGSLLWNSTADFWMGGALSNEKEFARFNATPTSGSVQVVSTNGLLVNSQISDDAIKVTIGTDLVISGLSASSFLVSNGSKKLISVTPSNAGDMVQWNGSSFIASNEIDGGSF